MHVIIKTMCPPGYHHNSFVATHALGHMMTVMTVLTTYIYIYMYIYIAMLHLVPKEAEFHVE